MKRTDTSDWPCTIARSAAVLGDHWNLLLIREACLGTRRFDDFQEALGIGRNILDDRLNGLVDEACCAGRVPGAAAHTPSTASPTGAATPTRSSPRWRRGATAGSPAPKGRRSCCTTRCDHDMHARRPCSECAADRRPRHPRRGPVPATRRRTSPEVALQGGGCPAIETTSVAAGRRRTRGRRTGSAGHRGRWRSAGLRSGPDRVARRLRRPRPVRSTSSRPRPATRRSSSTPMVPGDWVPGRQRPAASDDSTTSSLPTG